MNARDVILNSIRSALAVNGKEAPRHKEVADRLSGHPAGVVPARGNLPPDECVKLFVNMLAGANGTCEVVASRDGVPGAIGKFLRANNLPLSLRRGGDQRLASLPWSNEPMLEITTGASDGAQLTSVSHAFGAVAETGTLVLTAGPDNPTTLNFLPDNHVVVLDAADLDGDFETMIGKLREKFGPGVLPRVANMITGPSRSADIEQTLILGAHGPRRLHVVVVGQQ
ncbi:MAG: LutC/YkgG family protein [Xanthobacteraceae bacterium]